MPQKKPALKIGAHMSIAGGVFNAILHGEERGCTAIQMFTKSNQQWKAKKLGDDEIKRFFDEKKRTGIEVACVHASYLLNLGSPKKALREKSIKALIEELSRCDTLKIPHLVLHPGAHTGAGVETGIKHVANSINSAFKQYSEGTCKVCLETTAGQGTTLGRTFEELAEIIERIDDKKRVSICIDTCHVFAAGYCLNTEDGFKDMMKSIRKTIGVRRVAILHMNDSKFACGQNKDRHEHIGKGKIGLDGFRFVMNEKSFARLPKILETPKGSKNDMDEKNIQTLKSLLN